MRIKKDFRKSTHYLGVKRKGNKKLVNNENTHFIIWNLPAEKTCPFRTPHCSKCCYAKRDERYPHPREFRKRNYAETKKASFVEDMIFTIEKEVDVNREEGIKHTIVRIHESGDFYNAEYVDKWLEIAKHFSEHKDVVFMAYTKSVAFFEKKAIPENMTIRFSLWDDTPEVQIAMAKALKLPIYTVVDEKMFESENAKDRCRCSDCARCGKCWNKKAKMIVCKTH